MMMHNETCAMNIYVLPGTGQVVVVKTIATKNENKLLNIAKKSLPPFSIFAFFTLLFFNLKKKQINTYVTKLHPVDEYLMVPLI